MLLKILIAQLSDVYQSIREKAEVEAELRTADIVMRVDFDYIYMPLLCMVREFFVL